MEPILLPLNHDFSAFHVLLPVQGKEFSFSVHNVPNGEEFLRNAKLECNEELRMILRGVEHVVQERLKQSFNLLTFVLELKDVLERILRTEPLVSLPTPAFYSHLCSNLDAVGWEHLVWLAEDLSSLHLRIFDSAGREHIVLIDLPVGFPDVEPTASANLPVPLDLRSLHGASLKDIVLQYETAIERYQDFWKVMEDVDKKVWIMEPDHPSRADVFRRIALGGHCSLSIVVDPLSPRSVPELDTGCPRRKEMKLATTECRFFGSDAVIAPLRKRLNSGLRKWDQSRLLIANLEGVLEMTFPSAQDTDNEDMSADCGICYAYRAQDGVSDSDHQIGSQVLVVFCMVMKILHRRTREFNREAFQTVSAIMRTALDRFIPPASWSGCGLSQLHANHSTFSLGIARIVLIR